MSESSYQELYTEYQGLVSQRDELYWVKEHLTDECHESNHRLRNLHKKFLLLLEKTQSFPKNLLPSIISPEKFPLNRQITWLLYDAQQLLKHLSQQVVEWRTQEHSETIELCNNLLKLQQRDIDVMQKIADHKLSVKQVTENINSCEIRMNEASKLMKSQPYNYTSDFI